MSNITKMEIQQSIITLFNRGWSERRIARELGIHRQTVNLIKIKGKSYRMKEASGTPID